MPGDRGAGRQSGQQRAVMHNVWSSGGAICRDCRQRQCQIHEYRRLPLIPLLQVAGPEVGGAGASCALIIVLCRASWWVMWSFGETPDRPCGPPLPFRTGFTHRDEKVWGNWLSVNPFADDAGSCFVGVNGEEQHSLLPGLAGVSAG